jgi:hypothetical protein
MIDLALPFMRMCYRQRRREPRGLDFRLFFYDRQTCCWVVAISRLEFAPGALKEESKRLD